MEPEWHSAAIPLEENVYDDPVFLQAHVDAARMIRDGATDYAQGNAVALAMMKHAKEDHIAFGWEAAERGSEGRMTIDVDGLTWDREHGRPVDSRCSHASNAKLF